MGNETGWDAVKCCNINLTDDRSPPGDSAGRQDKEGKGRRGQARRQYVSFFPLCPGSFTQRRRMDDGMWRTLLKRKRAPSVHKLSYAIYAREELPSAAELRFEPGPRAQR